MFSSGPPELPGLMAASVWMKCWNWPLAPWLDGAVLGGDDAGGDGLRQREGAADGLHPVAHLRRVGVAQLDGRQRRAGVDLDHRQIGGLVDADHARRTAQILGVGIGGELDVDLVGLLDHVIVGDDVALGIDDEARAERLRTWPLSPPSGSGTWPPKKRLKKSWKLSCPLPC
jgi:hypothetical protein